MSAKIDLMADIPGVGVSPYALRCLVGATLNVLGVNQRVDDGCPTVETIYSHGLYELIADMSRVAEELDSKNDELGLVIRRFVARADLLNECAQTLAKMLKAEKHGGQS